MQQQKTDKSRNLEKIDGTVENITFHSEETGFCVLRVNTKNHRDLISVIGSAIKIKAGEYIECEGSWVNNKNYGLQFKAEQIKITPPQSASGIEKYLSSGLIKGIGKHYAKMLTKAFGKDVLAIFEKAPERLDKVPGIGPKRKAMIISSWMEQKAISNIMIFLQENGVGTARAFRIYKTYGDNAINTVKENPYRLSLDIHGIGFKIADSIAMRIGIKKDSIKRAQAGVRHVMQEFTSDGHTCVVKERLIKTGAALLEIPEDVIERALNLEISAENIVQDKIEGEDFIFLSTLYHAEKLSAKNILRLKNGTPKWGDIDTKKALQWVEEKTGFKLSPSQNEACNIALQGKITIITGGPGVGKTTIVNSILKIVRAKGTNVSLCAPTGRAAKRLSETTGLTAKTIHRLLEFDSNTRTFKRNQNNPLATDLVVVDEASMIDIMLMYSLLRAIPSSASLIIVGDIDQLPSVGPGAVLSDLIKSQILPVVRLTEIFRQAATSKIIVNAHRVNSGELPEKGLASDKSSDFYIIPCQTPEEINEKLISLITKRIPHHFGFHPTRDIQVLTPMNRGGLGSHSLNSSLQNALNPQGEPKINRFGIIFAPGDKVIQNVNNYDKEVFNGDIGSIVAIDTEENILKIDFGERFVSYNFEELDELSLAYATSIHKSQGSEYPVVIIPIATQHYMLLARNLLYTAITRGKKLVVLIGQMKAIAMAIKNVATEPRLTKLKIRLIEMSSIQKDA